MSTSKLLVAVAFVFFLLGFLTVVAGASLLMPVEGWVAGGLALWALAALV